MIADGNQIVSLLEGGTDLEGKPIKALNREVSIAPAPFHKAILVHMMDDSR